jgi:phosphoribosylformylglycinamidine synthase
VAIYLKPGVADPVGQAVEAGLHQLGFTAVHGLRLGKLIELTLEAEDEAAAEAAVEAMCRQLLANPVIESYSFAVGKR